MIKKIMLISLLAILIGVFVYFVLYTGDKRFTYFYNVIAKDWDENTIRFDADGNIIGGNADNVNREMEGCYDSCYKNYALPTRYWKSAVPISPTHCQPPPFKKTLKPLCDNYTIKETQDTLTLA